MYEYMQEHHAILENLSGRNEKMKNIFCLRVGGKVGLVKNNNWPFGVKISLFEKVR